MWLLMLNGCETPYTKLAIIDQGTSSNKKGACCEISIYPSINPSTHPTAIHSPSLSIVQVVQVKYNKLATSYQHLPALPALSASVISTSAGGTAAMYCALLGRAGSTNSLQGRTQDISGLSRQTTNECKCLTPTKEVSKRYGRHQAREQATTLKENRHRKREPNLLCMHGQNS